MDIDRRTKELSLKYIREEKTIILAVTAANVDIHTSEAIRLAKMVDPRMVRTLGVLTKPDTVEKGPDLNELVDVLSNKVLQLKKGYFVIKNRSMNEIENGMTAEDALQVHPCNKFSKYKFNTQTVEYTNIIISRKRTITLMIFKSFFP